MIVPTSISSSTVCRKLCRRRSNCSHSFSFLTIQAGAHQEQAKTKESTDCGEAYSDPFLREWHFVPGCSMSIELALHYH